MKGLICVVLFLGLLICALETSGQPVPDQDPVPIREPAQPYDDDVGGTSISMTIGAICPKGCRLKSIRDRRCVKKFMPRIVC